MGDTSEIADQPTDLYEEAEELNPPDPKVRRTEGSEHALDLAESVQST